VLSVTVAVAQRRCESCERLLGATSRPHRRYCRAACRQAGYERRRRAADSGPQLPRPVEPSSAQLAELERVLERANSEVVLVGIVAKAASTRPTDPVFAATSGKPKAYRNARRAVGSVADTLGVDLVSHDFRRSLASFLIVAARADEAAVTAVMGHANIETTRRIYAGDWREASERNALVLRQMADAGLGQ
jgi:hypothetical protein